jgi:hypothetical protein
MMLAALPRRSAPEPEHDKANPPHEEARGPAGRVIHEEPALEFETTDAPGHPMLAFSARLSRAPSWLLALILILVVGIGRVAGLPRPRLVSRRTERRRWPSIGR